MNYGQLLTNFISHVFVHFTHSICYITFGRESLGDLSSADKYDTTFSVVPVNLVPEASVTNSTTDSASVANPATCRV